MRPCAILLPDGTKLPAHLIRTGVKNSRVTFCGDRNVTDLVPTSSVTEIVEAAAGRPAPTPAGPYLHLCTQAAELSQKMETALSAVGVIAAPHMSLQEKWEALRQLRDGTHAVYEGEVMEKELVDVATAVTGLTEADTVEIQEADAA